MKICYLSDANSSHTKKWCNYFLNKGYEVSVISLNYGSIDGVKVYSFDLNVNKLKNKGAINKIHYLYFVNKIKKIVKEINPDILHAHYASSYGLLGSLVNFSPYIISVWGADVYDFPKDNIINELVIKYNLRKADYIFSTSECMAKETRKYVDKDIFVTPFGVDINKFKKIKNTNKDNFIIGTVKTLEDKYGIDYLIKGFALFKKKYEYDKMELHIAGKGSKLEAYKNLCSNLNIKNDVKFLGFLNEEKVVETLNSFDIAVFPSILDSESFGVAAVEAQACGVPVIISDIPGLCEATVPNKTSIVVHRKKPEEICDALESLYLSKEKRSLLGNNGMEFVKEKYDLNKNFGYVEDLYKCFVSKR